MEQQDSTSLSLSKDSDTNDDDDAQKDGLQSFQLELPEYFRTPKVGTRQRLRQFVHSTPYQVVLMVLVISEAALVVAELALEAERGDEYVIVGLHIASLFMLAVFAAELLFRLCVCPIETLKSWVEVLDGTVVVAAIALESYSFHHQGAVQAAGLLITLRLWRIIRILNNMRTAVVLAEERKFQQETQKRRKVELQLRDLKKIHKTLEEKCAALEKELRDRGIDFENFKNEDASSSEGQEATEGILK